MVNDMEDQPALKFSSPGEEFALLLPWKPLSSLLTPHWARSKWCNALLPPAESLPIISGDSSCWRQLEGDFYEYYSSCKVICAVVAPGYWSVSVINTSFNVGMGLQAARGTHSTPVQMCFKRGAAARGWQSPEKCRRHRWELMVWSLSECPRCDRMENLFVNWKYWDPFSAMRCISNGSI